MTSMTKRAGTVLEKLRCLSEDDSTTAFRDVARAIVELRSGYTHEDLPDWKGRSLEYREAIENLYRQAELPPDSESSVQAKLRYHIGNVVREVAPVEDLAALGLKPKGPADRAKDRPYTSRRQPAAVRRTSADNPLVLAALALDSLRLMNNLDTSDDDRPVAEKVVRQIMDECITYLSGNGGHP